MKKYLEPEVNIVKFQAEDVLASSELGNGGKRAAASPKRGGFRSSGDSNWVGSGWF
ncbi:MAG: hypothetical protein IJG23_00130 [Clostridia bacterium]|nr:hypothetical protein [Clostridia bacterium]